LGSTSRRVNLDNSLNHEEKYQGFIIIPMKKQYFGTDGIRGEVGQFPIVPEFMTRLGYAAGMVLTKNAKPGERSKVLIGKDTRISGYLLEAALEAGFAAAGVDVMLCGPMPTPAIAYLTKALRLSAGVVISASHNPYQDNGIKFFSAQGDKLSDDFEFAIEAELEKPMGCVNSQNLGKAFRLDDAAGRYIEFCKSTFPGDLNLKGMKLVVDCANGAAYHIAPYVFHELGAEVISIGVNPDGRNINDGCGATAPAALIAKVKETKAHLGIALDGDADRLQMVDETGRLFNGDELLYVLAKDRIDDGQKLGGVVGTLMTNLAIENAIRGLGIEFERANVGDRYVLEMLKQKDWLIGGEGSGHLLCLDHHSTGDGTIAALQVLAAMSQNKKSLTQLLDGVNIFPQVLLNVRYKVGYDWKADQNLAKQISQVETDLKGIGRVLIRASGTEPLVRVMVETQDAEIAMTAAKSIANLIPLA
jgi:phosphoglucosamine mutase